MKFEWEVLVCGTDNEGGCITHRAKVIGGWIVKNMCWADSPGGKDSPVQSESMVFIPDPNHEWEIAI